jgi:hypothetical protein
MKIKEIVITFLRICSSILKFEEQIVALKLHDALVVVHVLFPVVINLYN